jgi:signal transduction histidine kinase
MKRLDRVTSSGERMRRMIDQILDVTRARLTDGIRIDRQERDLVALVSKIVGEIQAAHPDRPIELSAPGPCRARVDADRFEQVVSNLVGNAVTHGDPVSPVEVGLDSQNGAASLTVRNDGPPIEPAELMSLFNPFQRVGKPRGRSDGLGLGLYISERIVSAHGGTIEVDSSELAGTRFEVIIPLDPPLDPSPATE